MSSFLGFRGVSHWLYLNISSGSPGSKYFVVEIHLYVPYYE